MVFQAATLTIPAHLTRRQDMAFDHVPLVQRAEAARWAIAELGVDPYLVLTNAISPLRYDD